MTEQDPKPFTPPTIDFNGVETTVESYVDFMAERVILRLTHEASGRKAQFAFTLDDLQTVMELLSGSGVDLELHLQGKGSRTVQGKHTIVES